MPTKNNNAGDTIYIGLCFAGAVSGGAYSAGVIDYIIEALDKWEHAKNNNDKDYPTHKVVIAGLTGASAGSIVNSLLPLDLAILDKSDENNNSGKSDEHRLKLLYETWVKSPRLYYPSDRIRSFLGEEDFKAANAHTYYSPPHGPTKKPLELKRLWSLLDSSLLDRIVHDVFSKAEDKLKATQKKGTAQPCKRDYIAEDLHSFMTLTNNVGVRYDINFNRGASGQHIMVRHADRAHFRIKGIGNTTFSSPWADPDPAPDCDLSDANFFDKNNANSKAYKNSTLASSAFPLGLGARKITHLTHGDYYARQWILPESSAKKIGGVVKSKFRRRPFFPEEQNQHQVENDIKNLNSKKLKKKYNHPVNFVASDGGVINNEPFEITRYILMEKPPDKNPRAGHGTRAALMIDPFPLLETNTKSVADNSMANVLTSLSKSLINESRFKPEELEDLVHEKVYSRFLISPHQSANQGLTGKKARSRSIDPDQSLLASGMLGGFGGFISESFRAYDYQLGRLHAWDFLHKSFGLPNGAGKNKSKILNSGYKNVRGNSRYNCGDIHHWQIIPVPSIPPISRAKLSWPQIDLSDFKKLMKEIKKRNDLIINNVVPNRFLRAFIKGIIRAVKFFNYSAVALLKKTILTELVKRDQLKEAKNLTQDQRKLVLEIIEAGEDGLKKEKFLESEGKNSIAKRQNLLNEILKKSPNLVIDGRKIKAKPLL